MSRILTILTLLLEVVRWLTREIDKRDLEERKDAIRADPRGELKRMFAIRESAMPDPEANPNDHRDVRRDSDPR